MICFVAIERLFRVDIYRFQEFIVGLLASGCYCACPLVGSLKTSPC